MPTVFVTGCDTGIGREFATQYAAQGWSVIATFRDVGNAAGLEGDVEAFALDVAQPPQFEAVKAAVGDRPIDVLLSNAGIGLDAGRLGALDFDFYRRMFDINALGALRLVETFIANVAASKQRRIIAISSRMGSIGLNISGGHYGYRASKAALNAMFRSLAVDLYPRGVTVSALHPGWVATPGGGGAAAVSVEDSVAAMRGVIAGLGSHETGQMFDYRGMPLTW